MNGQNELRRLKRQRYLLSSLFYPSALFAYGAIVVHQSLIGLGYYFACGLVCYWARCFDKIRQWPLSGRIAVLGSPIFVLLGVLIPFNSFWMWMIVIGYMGVAIAAGSAMRVR